MYHWWLHVFLSSVCSVFNNQATFQYKAIKHRSGKGRFRAKDASGANGNMLGTRSQVTFLQRF